MPVEEASQIYEQDPYGKDKGKILYLKNTRRKSFLLWIFHKVQRFKTHKGMRYTVSVKDYPCIYVLRSMSFFFPCFMLLDDH